MGTISSKAVAKVAGPSWDLIRPQFSFVTELLLAVAPEVFAELTTIYIKFTLDNTPTSPVFAVIWVKNSKSIVVGFALPDGIGVELSNAPKGMSYKGLTRYLTIIPGKEVPFEVADWAKQAYQNIKKNPGAE